jgi:DNA-binding HxlR family transcriptional regulator
VQRRAAPELSNREMEANGLPARRDFEYHGVKVLTSLLVIQTELDIIFLKFWEIMTILY